MDEDLDVPARRLKIDNADPRAVRTRSKLVDAFHDAIEHAEPKDMSVSALSRIAGINRTSFYMHFSSPEDLAIHALGELFEVVGNADIVMRSEHITSAEQASRQALGDVVHFLNARRRSYRRLLGPGAAPQVLGAITDAFTARTLEALRNSDKRPPDVDPAVTAQFLAGGVLGVIGRWLAQDPDAVSPDALVDSLVRCLPAWLNED